MKVPSVRIPVLHRGKSNELPGVVAPARLDRRTKNLTKRLCPGDIAIIDHLDLDRVAADALISRKVSAVVNAAVSMSGRYPNLGPQLLMEAGIPLVDGVGHDIFGKVREGATVRLDGDTLYAGEQVVAKGTPQTPETVDAMMAEARAGIVTQIEAFAANTMEFLKREHQLLVDGVALPDTRTRMDGRHVLVVVRGYHYREDLAALRPYIREYRPVLVGVDGGADALLEAGYVPDAIVGDMDSVTDQTLRCGAELIVHAYADGRAPGLNRINELGLTAAVCPAAGTSEDVALLLADGKGAILIVAVGTHWTLEEFLDKGRSGMASTFLTQLRVGTKIVNAKGVSRLYRSRISSWSLIVLALAAAVTVFVAVAASPAEPILIRYFDATWHSFVSWLSGLFT
ncbi:MAG TPA: putative cytokinetic ring protein SteA [Streptosporangiaceae bacterium]|jgi:uncharacterized membrane-anchored protein|nr:putative cytokinetic ring protein SteA [Streptosporangiaceae bacterium]